MEAKLCVLFLAVLCASFCSAQVVLFEITKVDLLQKFANNAEVAPTTAEYDEIVYRGTAAPAGSENDGYYEYRFFADGKKTESTVPTSKTLVTQDQLDRSQMEKIVSNDLSALFGSSDNCNSDGAIKFGKVLQFPTFDANQAVLPFVKKLIFSVWVKKDLYCSFQISGLKGTEPNSYGANKFNIDTNNKRTVLVNTFTDFRYAVLPEVPSAQASITAGGPVTALPNKADFAKERLLEWSVITNHPVDIGKLPTVVDFSATPAGIQCCDNAACNGATGNNCQLRLVPNNHKYKTRWRYIQLFKEDNAAIKSNLNDPNTRRGLDFKAVTSVPVLTQAIPYPTSLTTAFQPAVLAANVNIRLSGGKNLPITDARYFVDNSPLQLENADNLVHDPVRNANNQDPISTLKVKFNKAVTFFRYNTEFFIRVASLDPTVITDAALAAEFRTRYTVTSTPDATRKVWTISFSPPIYAPGKYTVYVVTACPEGTNCQSSTFRRPYDTTVPIPGRLTPVANQPAGWDKTLTSAQDNTLPAGLDSKGREFVKNSKCTQPLRKCNNEVCKFVDDNQCDANCAACPTGKVCQPNVNGDSVLLLAGAAACGAKVPSTFTGITDADLGKRTRFNTNPESDPKAGNVRIFPFSCLPGTTPEVCHTVRDSQSIWDAAPAILSNQVYVVNRRVRFTMRGVNGLRFNLYSYLCTKKATVTTANLNRHELMFVRNPGTQRNRNFFQGVSFSNDAAFDVEFWMIKNQKCNTDTYAPVIIDLIWAARKRSLSSMEAVLADDARVNGHRDQIQVRAQNADILNLDMDKAAPVVLRSKCSGSGIKIDCFFQLDKPGKVVVTVLPSDAIVPTLPKVLAGQDAAGGLAPHIAINCPTTGTECSGSVSGLVGSTDYIAHFVAYDTNNEPNVQDTVSTTRFTTSSLASTPNAVSITTNFANMVEVK